MPFGLLSLVPASTLLGALASLEPESGGTPRELAWAEWGPRGSRLISAPPTHSPVWVCYVYGTTFVASRRKNAGRVVNMLDFNQLAIRLAQSGEDPEGAHDIVADPIVFKPAKVFKEEVMTALPYRLRSVAPGEGHFEAVMVAEDALVLVSSVSGFVFASRDSVMIRLSAAAIAHATVLHTVVLSGGRHVEGRRIMCCGVAVTSRSRNICPVYRTKPSAFSCLIAMLVSMFLWICSFALCICICPSLTSSPLQDVGPPYDVTCRASSCVITINVTSVEPRPRPRLRFPSRVCWSELR